MGRFPPVGVDACCLWALSDLKDGGRLAGRGKPPPTPPPPQPPVEGPWGSSYKETGLSNVDEWSLHQR